MLDSIEVSAKTVNDAVALAVQKLGKKPEDVDVEILSEGSRGILGIGAEDARVRVRVRRPAPAPERPAPPPERPAPPERVTRPPVAVAPASRTQAAATPEGEPGPDVSADEAAIVKEVVQDLLRLMGLRATVTIRGLEPRGVRTPDDGTPTCTADISGDDLGIMIGRRGENLSALQYIVNLIVARRTGNSNLRVVVDVEHYLVRRYESLRGLAQRMAERVAHSKSPITLEPMPPHERRIVHMTLAEHPQVTTFSIGEGEERRVVVSPKK